MHLSPHTLSKFGMSSHIDQQHSFLQSTSTNSGQQTSTRSTPEHVTLGPKLLSQSASRARTGTGRGKTLHEPLERAGRKCLTGHQESLVSSEIRSSRPTAPPHSSLDEAAGQCSIALQHGACAYWQGHMLSDCAQTKPKVSRKPQKRCQLLRVQEEMVHYKSY